MKAEKELRGESGRPVDRRHDFSPRRTDDRATRGTATMRRSTESDAAHRAKARHSFHGAN